MNTVQSIKTAILNGVSNYNGIPLPSPQTGGTMTQRNSYAQVKAQEIFEEHFQ